MSLKGKVALITGGGKNLGTESARQLAKEGVNLALHYNSSRSKESTLHFRDEVLNIYPGVIVSVHAGDLSTAAAVDALFSDVLSEHKKIDIVVNTAGIVLKKPITTISEADYDKVSLQNIFNIRNSTMPHTMFSYAVFVDEQRRRCVDQYHSELSRKRLS